MEASQRENLYLTGQRGSGCGVTDPCAPPRVSRVALSQGAHEPIAARLAGVLNRLLAALFLVGSPIVGATIGAHYGFHVVREAALGFLAGLAAGVFLTLVVCGPLALIVSIHDTLNDIHRLLGETTADISNRDPESASGPVSPPGP